METRTALACCVVAGALATRPATGQTQSYEAYYRYLGDYPDQLQSSYSEELQGIAHDDTHWYLIQVDGVWRVPLTVDLNAVFSFLPGVSYRSSSNMGPASGVDHLGDGEVYRDPVTGISYLVIAVEGPNGLLFLRADATLAYVKDVLWDGVNSLQTSSPWTAVDPAGQIYCSNFDDVTTVYRYTMDWSTLQSSAPAGISYAGDLTLSYPADGVQGGVFSPSGDRLYLVADAIRVYANPSGQQVQASSNGSGLFNFQYDPSFFVAEEPEGVTIWDLDGAGAPGISGQLHVVLLDNDEPDDDDIYLKHYSGVLYVDENGTPFFGNGTWSNPYPTFTEAVSAAWSGVRIEVAPGTYVPAGVLVTGPAMLLQGTGGGPAVLGN